jgi:hypothetical protein
MPPVRIPIRQRMSPYDIDIHVDGETLVAQWDNRQLKQDRFTVIFLTAFWVVWTPVTLLMTYNLIYVLGQERTPKYWFGVAMMSIWLVFGYMGVILIPRKLLRLLSVERIEIDGSRYRHVLVNRPWLLSIDWDVRDISRIVYGKQRRASRESIATLSVHRGWRRDMIAYFAPAEFRWELFNQMRAHLKRIGSAVPIGVASEFE